MSKLEKNCYEILLCSKCPLKKDTYLCKIASQEQDVTFEDVIKKIEKEIGEVKNNGRTKK